MTDANDLLRRVELRRLWAFFHKDWLLQIRTLLRPQLPREYCLFVESEAVVVTPLAGQIAAPVLPDLAIGGKEGTAGRKTRREETTQATVEVEESCEQYTAYTLLIRRSPGNRLVAVCELLSPTNKGVFGDIYKEKHLKKRERYLDAGINTLEIDALLEGQRVLPQSVESLSEYGRNAWTVFHQDGKRKWRGWGWNADDDLPKIPWHVEEDLEISVDLPAALKEAVEFNPWHDLAREG